jgi:hypothetical protein
MGRRQDREKPFMDVRGESASFSIPRRKWRELVFIGAMKPEGNYFVRDPSRPLPLFRDPNLFPEGVRFVVREEGKRAYVQRVD